MTTSPGGSLDWEEKEMQNRFEKEIDAVLSEIEQMYAAVIENYEKASTYYLKATKPDLELIIDDDKINAYERAIESLCMQILLKETVYSQDFRKVSGSLKLVDCLERIGDEAYDIKWMGDDIKATPYPLPLEGMEKMITAVNQMLRDGLKAYMTRDEALCADLIERDDIIDKAYWDGELALAKAGDEKKVNATKVMLESQVLKFYERVADQVTNVAEWTVYIKTGYHKDRVII